MTEPPERVVVDASVLVDLLAGTDVAPAARARLANVVLHARLTSTPRSCPRSGA